MQDQMTYTIKRVVWHSVSIRGNTNWNTVVASSVALWRGKTITMLFTQLSGTQKCRISDSIYRDFVNVHMCQWKQKSCTCGFKKTTQRICDVHREVGNLLLTLANGKHINGAWVFGGLEGGTLNPPPLHSSCHLLLMQAPSRLEWQWFLLFAR